MTAPPARLTPWGRLLAIPAGLAGLIVLAMVAAVTAEVVLRALRGFGIFGVIEATEIGLLLSAVLAAPWLLHGGQHIRADILAETLPPRGARLLEILADALGAAVCAVLAWEAGAVTAQNVATGAVIRRSFDYPEWSLSAVLIPSFALLAAEFVRRLWRALRDPAGARAEGRALG